MRRIFLMLGLSVLLSAPTRAAPGHLDRVLATHVLRACIWPDFYGISYRNPHTQQLTGLDVDMAREFAKDLGVELRFVDTSFAKLIDDVTEDRCDIAMFAIGVTPQRAAKLRFTQPHLVSDFYAITTRSNRRIKNWSDIDQPGVVVAAIKGTIHEAVLRKKLTAATLLVVDNAQARELEVESGRADVFMATSASSRNMLDRVDWARGISPPSTYHLTPFAYAVQPGDDPWFARVEQFVATIKRDGRLLESARRHQLETIVTAP